MHCHFSLFPGSKAALCGLLGGAGAGARVQTARRQHHAVRCWRVCFECAELGSLGLGEWLSRQYTAAAACSIRGRLIWFKLTRLLSATRAIHWTQCSQRLRGAMVARRTPVPKAACSSHVGVKADFCFAKNWWFRLFYIVICFCNSLMYSRCNN